MRATGPSAAPNTAGEVAHQGLVYGRVIEGELVDLLGEGHPRHRHLILDRARLRFAELSDQQVADDAAHGSCWRFTAVATISS